MHVAVGFMPAFKYRQKNSLIVLERGHKAHGYVAAGDASKTPIGCPPINFQNRELCKILVTSIQTARRLTSRFTTSAKSRI